MCRGGEGTTFTSQVSFSVLIVDVYSVVELVEQALLDQAWWDLLGLLSDIICLF